MAMNMKAAETNYERDGLFRERDRFEIFFQFCYEIIVSYNVNIDYQTKSLIIKDYQTQQTQPGVISELTLKKYFGILREILYMYSKRKIQYFKNSKGNVLDYNGPIFMENILNLLDEISIDLANLKVQKEMEFARLEIFNAIEYWRDNGKNNPGWLLTKIYKAKEGIQTWF